MTARTMSSTGSREDPRQPGGRRPRVIVDFEVDANAFVIAVRNIGDEPAGRVRVTFEPGFRGLGGTVDIPALPVFRRLTFLAPGREIRIFVDAVNAYLGRRKPEEPRNIRVTVTYGDASRRRYRARIRHDLGIWENLPRPPLRSDDG
jgi:hypothetical protein